MNTSNLCLKKTSLHSTSTVKTSTFFQEQLATVKSRLRHWNMNRRTRQQLAQLNSYQLKDIGISISEAQEEASKAFWKD